MTNFDMKAHRKRIREQRKLNKEKRQPALSFRNAYGVLDLTPYNAVQLIRYGPLFDLTYR